MNECYHCGFSDEDYGCTCPHSDKWYACPIEAKKENTQALKQEPCGDDAISRQAVLDIINFEDKWLLDTKSHNADTNIAFLAIKSKISELTSVIPQRNKDGGVI